MTMKKIPDGREWLSAAEAARRAGIDPKKLREHVRAGRLRGYYKTRKDGRPSSHMIVSAADLDAYMRRYPAMSPRDVMHAVGVFAIMAVGMAWPIIEGLAW